MLSILFAYRRFRYNCAFRRIPLTQGKFAIVDPEDYEHLNEYKWYLCRCPRTCYAQRKSRRSDNVKASVIKMHRQILDAPAHLLVDHINHNGLDNRKANLRLATQTQNQWNRSKIKGVSKYKGVSWHKVLKKWSTTITSNHKTKHLGYFDDELQAAKAYDSAAKKHHGQFANLNFKPKKTKKRPNNFAF